MTIILNPGFEDGYSTNWTAINQGWGVSFGNNISWYTEGIKSAFCAMAAHANRIATDYAYFSQDINFNSDFTLKIDFNIENASTYYELRVYVDSNLEYSKTATPTGVTTDQSIIISGYSGTHTLKFGLYCITTSTTESARISFDNLRIESETGDKFVDIATGNDADGGDSWTNAYLTVKKGVDNVGAIRILHIAEGDYSAQAAITLNKNLELVCEDYGGGIASPPLTVTLPPTA